MDKRRENSRQKEKEEKRQKDKNRHTVEKDHRWIE